MTIFKWMIVLVFFCGYVAMLIKTFTTDFPWGPAWIFATAAYGFGGFWCLIYLLLATG